jgi:hypothetical protein
MLVSVGVRHDLAASFFRLTRRVTGGAKRRHV